MVYLFLAPLQQNSGHYIPFPQPENLKTFQWFTSSWPLYSKTPATTSHSHSLKTSKVESLFFPKNWQLYFSVVYLFLTPLQQNSGHYIPYITCFFPQPEKPKSRVPFFSEKLATLLCSLLPCYFCSSRPSTARPPPVHSPSTARPPDPDIRSRSSVSSLLPCYFCSSRPSTARPPPVHSPSTGSWHSLSLLVSSLLPCYFCSSRPSTARPPPAHRILTFALAPPSLASSHAISAAPARPQPVHRPSTGSGHSLSLLHL